jgi:predicted DNA-binding protein YlxM (UPF0122 family)
MKQNQLKVGRKTVINSTLIHKIKTLKQQDYSIRVIAEKTGVSKSTVYKVLKDYLNYKSNFILKSPKNGS